MVRAGNAPGRLIEVSHELMFGRGEDGVGRLEGDVQLSRRHARIGRAADGFFVEDLGSRNGTRVNGRVIERPQVLAEGDELELGSTRLTVRPRASRPTRLALSIELDPARQVAEISVGGGVRLTFEEGRWRFASE